MQYPKPNFDIFFCSVTVCIEQSYAGINLTDYPPPSTPGFLHQNVCPAPGLLHNRKCLGGWANK